MAAKYDDRTARGWPLPRQGNRLYDDVERLREALTLIDQSITAVDTHESAISERQDFIETRMDVIVGQATEDTETLDARVDAEGVVHPNLGHNIRNVHVTLVRLVDDFQGLLRQFTALAEAQIQGELNSLEAHERRKKEIQLEALTRLLQDDGLQSQIDEASTAILQTTLNLYDNNNRRKADLEQEQIARANDVDYLQGQIITLSKLLKLLTEALSETNETVDIEAQARVDGDLGLARQANANAEAVMRTELNLLDANERLKAKLSGEEQARNASDKDLQVQVGEVSNASLENSLAIAQEAERRRDLADEVQDNFEYLCDEDARLDTGIETEAAERKAEDEALKLAINSEKSARVEQISRLDGKLNAETQARVDGDLGLARQANANAEAVMRTELNLLDADRRRKEELAHEERERIEHDADLQAQVDKTSAASLENSLAIAQEAERRRDLADEVQDNFEYLCDEDARLDAEIETEAAEREAEDEALKLAINSEKSARAEQISRLDEELNAETQARVDGDLGLARQANANAEAVMRTELNLLDADRRRKEDSAHEERERIEHDTDLQRQIDRTAESSLENALNLHQETEQRRKSDERIEALRDEADHQREVDDYHQTQIDDVVQATLENSVTFSEGMEQRRKDIHEESQARYSEDVNQQAQTDTASAAILQNVVNLAEEAQKRRELAERLIEEVHDREREIQNLLVQIGELYEIPLPGIDKRFATLQMQTDANAEASLENSMSIHTEAEQRRKAVDDLTDGITRNADNDTHNQAQIATLVNALLEDALNLRDEISRRREALTQEAQKRIEADADLQTQVDHASTAGLENTVAIAQEAEQRRKSDERIDNLKDESDHQRETDEFHQTQIDDVVRATLENSVTSSEGMERRREALIQEAEARITGDKDLQIQVDKVSNASLENSLAIANETKQRRKFGDRIKTLENDSELSVERDTYHQTQLDFLVAAVLQGAANLHDEIERRRVAVDGEAKALAKHSRILQSEIDKTAMAILENFLAVQKSNEARRAEDSQERFTRFDEDGHIQAQVNALAETCMRIMTTNAETQEKINKIAKAAESISDITGVADDAEVDEMLDEIYNS